MSSSQVVLNSQFQDNQELIQRLQNTLLQDIAQLKLLERDFKLTNQFINDKVSVFRSLKDHDFQFDRARSNLLTTIQWRLDTHMDQLTMDDCFDFVEKGFAFFHGTDTAGDHPLIFVRLRCFPKHFRESHKSLTDQIRPYAAFIMEIARKRTLEMTLERMNQGHPSPLVSGMTVLVNVTQAPILPVDSELIKTMGVILNERFPGLIQSINVLNFGWMYQGVWSVLKYLLSEEAKSFIRFTTIQELSSFVSSDRILQEMGGSDTFCWSIENDDILQKYGKGSKPPDVMVSESSISNSDSSEEFFDAEDTWPQPPSSSTPHARKLLYGTSCAGLRMGADFLTSFIDPTTTTTTTTTKEEEDEDDATIVVEYQHMKKHSFLYNIQAFSKNLIPPLLGPSQGLAYWVVVYLFLRGPVESVVRTSLVHTSMVEPKRIASTTLGITAVVAAVVGAGLTSTLEKLKR